MRLMKVGALRETKHIFLAAIRTKLLTSNANMEREFKLKGKPAENILLEILKDTCSKIDGPHQQKALFDTMLFFLFTYHKDNAHHEQGNYLLHQVCLRSDEILAGLEKERKRRDYLDPKQWRVNQWMEQIKQKKLKKEQKEKQRKKKPN